MNPAVRVLVVSCAVGGGLGGCHEVSGTGPYGIKGQLVDSGGRPISGQSVVSEEHGVTTDGAGEFNVRWKEPAAFVDIARGGVLYRRAWGGAQDQGHTVVRLPSTTSLRVSCTADVPCISELRWGISDNLTGRLDVPCQGGQPVTVDVPAPTPTISCTAGGQSVALTPRVTGETMVLTKAER